MSAHVRVIQFGELGSGRQLGSGRTGAEAGTGGFGVSLSSSPLSSLPGGFRDGSSVGYPVAYAAKAGYCWVWSVLCTGQFSVQAVRRKVFFLSVGRGSVYAVCRSAW